jgi:hypothetical protein
MDAIIYCRSCGTKIVGPAEKCFICRTDPLAGNAYCPGCGSQTRYFVKNCLDCGAALSYTASKFSKINPKSKSISILLALSVGLFTWLYTYKQDAKKFWFSLALTAAGLMVFSSTFKLVFGNSPGNGIPSGPNTTWLLPLMVSFMAISGLWAWSVLDVMRKGNDWYSRYPNHTA